MTRPVSCPHTWGQCIDGHRGWCERVRAATNGEHCKRQRGCPWWSEEKGEDVAKKEYQQGRMF